MKFLLLAFALSVSAFGQGTTPTTGVFTLASPGGYPVLTIGQFDKAVWIPTRGCYALWGQYKTQTFSEENDSLGCLSYAENWWHLLEQSSSAHSVHRSQTGHNWGYTDYYSPTDTLYWTANSGSQDLDTMWSQYRYDMAGLSFSDIPLMSNSGVLTRQWQGGAQTPSGYQSSDWINNLMVFFPDGSLTTGKLTVCTIGFGTTMACTQTAATGGPAAVGEYSSLRWDQDDGQTYFLVGGTASVYSINAASPGAWKPFTSPSCTGADCVSGAPAVRVGAGWAYSTVAHKWLMIGGLTGTGALNTWGTPLIDAWTFDPAAGSGAGAWVEVCGPSATVCGTAGTTYPTFTSQRIGDRLVYDPADNVFIIVDDNGAGWYYALSAATGNYGRTAVSYAPCSSTVPNCTTGVVGPINRTLPPTSAGSSNAQTDAFDLSVDSNGGNLYLSRVEASTPSNTTPSYCIFPIPYIWSSASGGTWLPAGTQATACTAINNGTANQPSGHVYHATVAGVEWEANDRRNFSGFSSDGQSQAQSYNSGTQTWSGVNIGCFSATCFSNGGSLPQNYMQGLINANGTLTALTIEMTQDFYQESSVYVSQWNGTSFVSLTGSTPLNVLSPASYPSYASLAADPSGNIMVCWSEEQDSTGRTTMLITPQIECKYWNGSSFSVIGGGSLNVSASSWARSPSVVYASGTWYIGWTEQSQTGYPKLYVFSCPLSGSCSMVGSGALNHTPSTGIAYHPSLAANGATPVVGWEEQSAPGQYSLLYVSQWNGSAWTSVASGVSANTSGSVIDTGIAVTATGTVKAGWAELVWGNLPQVYYDSFSLAPTLSVPITVTEALFPGDQTGHTDTANTGGISRTNEPFCTGVPIADSVGLTVTTSLGLTGTYVTAGQFRVTENWPDGNIKALKVCGQLSTYTASTPQTVTLTNSGSGNFGGSNLATDNGSTITVATGTATFTITKANFDGIDQAVVGSTTIISSGASLGLVLIGPLPTATYPANVTCLPTSGGSACATLYASKYDSGSTCAIDQSGNENGPAMAVIKCSGHFLDSTSTYTYMAWSARLFFYAGRSNIDIEPVLHNADFGAANTFASAYKGYQSFELRLTTNDTGGATMNYLVNYVGTPGSNTNYSGTLNHSGGTDYAYLYTAETTNVLGGQSVNSGNYCVNPTTTTANFTQPAASSNVSVSVVSTSTLSSGQTVYVIGGGYYTVSSRTSGTVVVLTNLGSAGNAAPTSTVNSGANLSVTQVVTDGEPANICVPSSFLTGWAIVANGTAVESGSGTFGSVYVPGTSYMQGWMDIYDSNGAGVEVGQDEFVGYGNKSLEARGGGTDIRIGLWAYENNTVSPSTIATQGTNNYPYYMAWPQIRIEKAMLNFHATSQTATVASSAFLSRQHYLIGSPAYTYWNAAGVLFEPMLNPTQETAYYTSIVASASPATTTPVVRDSGATDMYNWPLYAWRWYNWSLGGVGNQSEYHMSFLHNFVRRGLTGQFLDAASYYKMIAQTGFPMADFTGGWQGHPTSIIYWDQPIALENFTVANCASSSACLGNLNWIGPEHAHVYGMGEYYLATGDETIHDAILSGMLGWLAGISSTNSVFATGSGTNNRAVGVALMLLARMHNFLISTGDTTDAATIESQTNTIITNFILPDMCSYAGYPSGCTPNASGGGVGSGQVGVSRVRGLPYVSVSSGNQGNSQPGCPNYPATVRDTATLFDGNLLLGLYESLTEYGASWANYTVVNDLAYGITQFEFSESYKDDGTSAWSTNGVPTNALYQIAANNPPSNYYASNGFVYKGAIDSQNNCNAANQNNNFSSYEYSIGNPDAAWPIWFYNWQYAGQGNASTAQRQLAMVVQSALAAVGSNLYTEPYHNTLGMAINLVENANTLTLQALTPTVTSAGGTSYNVSWTTPSGTTALRVKYAADASHSITAPNALIGFNPGTYTFIGNPATTTNWFAATNATGIPAPVTGSQTLVVNTGVSGMTAANFAVSAMAPAGGGGSVMFGSTVMKGNVVVH